MRAYGVLVRLVALSLTVLLIAAACEVALDLVAWQCAGSGGCADTLPFPRADGPWGQPGRRLALGALLPAALTGLLWYLSNRTWSAYESQPPPPAPPSPTTPRTTPPHSAARILVRAPARGPAARRPHRRRTAHRRGRRRRTHRRVRPPRGDPVLEAAGWVLQALLAGTALSVACVVCRRGRTEARPDHRLDRAAVALLPRGALGLLGAVLVYACWSRPGWTSTGRLPGDFAFGALMLGQGCCALALAVVARRLHRAAPDPAAALRGLGGPAVAMLGCALGGVMSGGVAQRVADWLDGGDTPAWPEPPCPGRPYCSPGRPPCCRPCCSSSPCSPPGSP